MLGIVGIVAIVVFTIQVYKGASNTGRNAALWAIINVVTGIVFQFVLPLIFGIVVGVYYVLSGSALENLESDIQAPAAVIGILFLVISIAAMFFIWKHVGKVPDVPPGTTNVPPAPPTFGQGS